MSTEQVAELIIEFDGMRKDVKKRILNGMLTGFGLLFLIAFSVGVWLTKLDNRLTNLERAQLERIEPLKVITDNQAANTDRLYKLEGKVENLMDGQGRIEDKVDKLIDRMIK